MRCTQFIGLTQRAEEYVKNLKSLESDGKAAGMFPEEEINLRRWEVPSDFKNDIHHGRCIREVVQAVPWSSGPMIFTCLELDFNNSPGTPDAARVKMLQWIDDPKVKGLEYDQETGRLWI